MNNITEQGNRFIPSMITMNTETPIFGKNQQIYPKTELNTSLASNDGFSNKKIVRFGIEKDENEEKMFTSPFVSEGMQIESDEFYPMQDYWCKEESNHFSQSTLQNSCFDLSSDSVMGNIDGWLDSRPSFLQTQNIYSFEKSYGPVEVEIKQRRKLASRYDSNQIEEIIKKAYKLASFVLADNSQLTSQQKTILFQELQTKFPKNNQKDLEEAIKGKVLSLAIKTEDLFNQARPGDFLQPSVLSSKKSGKIKISPINRLLNHLDTQIFLSSVQVGQHVHLICLKHLGSGTFNHAKLVYDMERGELLVHRTLNQECLNNSKTILEWENEVRQHHQLDQKVPGLVKMHDVFILDTTVSPGVSIANQRGLLLERCDGDLSELINDKLDPSVQVSMMRQLAATVAIMHESGVTHGDLKPNNVFFKGEEIKVADLGSVKFIGERGDMEGTFFYQSPESFVIGKKNNPSQEDPAIDNYALGLIIYELKYGDLGFISSAIDAVTEEISFLHTAKQMNFDPSFFSALNALLSFDESLRNSASIYLKQMDQDPDELKILAEKMFQKGLLNPNHPLHQGIHSLIQQVNFELPSLQDRSVYVYNALIQTFIHHQYLSIYQQLKHQIGFSQDLRDVAILGLLDPNVNSRWTAKKVVNYFQSAMRI